MRKAGKAAIIEGRLFAIPEVPMCNAALAWENHYNTGTMLLYGLLIEGLANYSRNAAASADEAYKQAKEINWEV